MKTILFLECLLLYLFGSATVHAQLKTSILIQSTSEDERVYLSIDRSVYFPGDTVRLEIHRYDSTTTAAISPFVSIEGVRLRATGFHTYFAVIPGTVTPGLYPIKLRVTDDNGRRFRYDTDCIVTVEEPQDVEQLSRFVTIIPEAGSNTIQTASTIDRNLARNLEVHFLRDSIRENMGPQFVRITTKILLRDGVTAPSYERRMVTFRSHGDAERDRAMFVQYRTAYGAFANIRPDELESVLVPVDSLPDWAILVIRVEPDYTIKIGAVDRTNKIDKYFRVKGPSIEIGFSLAIPKVLYDTQASDTIQYGNTSAMVRMYFINSKTGNRFPISAGIGMFGASSPLDVGIGRGGFALSMFLDLAEMIRIVNVGFTKKINIGLEIDPFLPIKKRGRFLLVAQAGFSF